MRNRVDLILKAACLGLGVLLIAQLARVVLAKDPLAEINLANLTPPPKAGEASVPPSPTKTTPPPAAHSTSRPATSGTPGVSDLPVPIQARVEKIKESELFGPVSRPLPMALLGIAGPDVFLRTPGGQTGLVREGAELGGVKILQVGTNRVLVEHEGKSQELLLHAGFGGETLLQKKKETTP